jgi:adenylylsulfate kinase
MDNIFEQNYQVSKSDRESIMGNKSLLVWFTGLSGSGKSTIANLVELELHKLNIITYSLDGDNIRHGINKDLTFSETDRKENIRRIAEVSKLFVDAGVVTFAAFVSPYLKDIYNIKDIVGYQNFVEVYVNTSIEECERRDVKGLYKKARAGEIRNMTGIDAPYESPIHPDIEIITEKMTIEESVKQVVEYIKNKITLKNE